MQQARQRMQNMSPAAIFESVTATLTKKAEDRSAEECFFFAEWIMGLNIPIFENLHETTVKALGKYSSIRKYASGENVVRQGEAGRSFKVLVEGELDVILNKDGKEKGVAILQSPAMIGAECLFGTEPHTRTATLRARAEDEGGKGGATIVSISSEESLKAASEGVPDNPEALRERFLENSRFLASHYLLEGLFDKSEITSFSYCLRPLSVARLNWLYEIGSKADSVYFITKGECFLYRRDGNAQRGRRRRFEMRKNPLHGFLRLTTLGPGSFLGENDIVNGRDRRTQGAWCSTDCEFLAVSRYHFLRYFKGERLARVKAILKSKVKVQEELLESRQRTRALALQHRKSMFKSNVTREARVSRIKRLSLAGQAAPRGALLGQKSGRRPVATKHAKSRASITRPVDQEAGSPLSAAPLLQIGGGADGTRAQTSDGRLLQGGGADRTRAQTSDGRRRSFGYGQYRRVTVSPKTPGRLSKGLVSHQNSMRRVSSHGRISLNSPAYQRDRALSPRRSPSYNNLSARGWEFSASTPASPNGGPMASAFPTRKPLGEFKRPKSRKGSTGSSVPRPRSRKGSFGVEEDPLVFVQGQPVTFSLKDDGRVESKQSALTPRGSRPSYPRVTTIEFVAQAGQ